MGARKDAAPPTLAALRRATLYSEELGIHLLRKSDPETFKWFLASLLFGARPDDDVYRSKGVMSTLQRRRARLLGRFLGRALLRLAATWKVEGTEAVRTAINQWKGTPLLVGCWHGKYFPLFVLLRSTQAKVFIGEGFRGTAIEAICQSLDFSPVLLPHGDKDQALERMRTALTGDQPCATAFDGPLGPPRRVKPSLIELAAKVGARILPISMSADPVWVLRWRWDSREVPWPFARVTIFVGDPIKIPVGLPRGLQAEWCERVESAFVELDRAAHRRGA